MMVQDFLRIHQKLITNDFFIAPIIATDLFVIIETENQLINFLYKGPHHGQSISLRQRN